MDKLTWRPRAKVVAVIDIVIAANHLIGLVALFIINILIALFFDTIIKSIKNRPTDPGNEDPHESAAYAFPIWIPFVIAGVIIVFAIPGLIQLWVACKLLNATDTGKAPHKSFAKARIYRSITIIFFVIGVLINVVAMITIGWGWILFVSFLIHIIFRGTMLCIVFNFINELDSLDNPKMALSNIAGVKVYP